MSKVKGCRNISDFIRHYIYWEIQWIEKHFYLGNCDDYKDHWLTVYPKTDNKFLEQAEYYFSLHGFPIEIKEKEEGYMAIVFKHDIKELRDFMWTFGKYYEYMYDYYTYRDGYLKDLKDFLKEIKFSIDTNRIL